MLARCDSDACTRAGLHWADDFVTGFFPDAVPGGWPAGRRRMLVPRLREPWKKAGHYSRRRSSGIVGDVGRSSEMLGAGIFEAFPSTRPQASRGAVSFLLAADSVF